jgi:hypothetical protein
LPLVNPLNGFKENSSKRQDTRQISKALNKMGYQRKPVSSISRNVSDVLCCAVCRTMQHDPEKQPTFSAMLDSP